MNKRGFTLVEILVAVVLIGLLLGIGIPGTIKISERMKQKSFNTKVSLIEQAATYFGESNKNLLKEGTCEIDGKEYLCKKISIETLIEEEYLDSENTNELKYEDPTTKENIVNKCVYIYSKNNRVYAHYSNDNTCDITIVEKDDNDINADINNSMYLSDAILKSKVIVEDYDENGVSKGLITKNEIKSMPQSIYEVADDAEDSGIFTAVDDYGTSYVYRGTIRNNYVEFANMIWRIVRINGDGSIRLVLEKTLKKECGDKTPNICKDSKYNTFAQDAAYAGYMYGLPNATTTGNGTIGRTKNRCLMYSEQTGILKKSTNKSSCIEQGGTWTTNAYEATNVNLVSSTIKKVIDNFYKEYMIGKTNNSNYIEDYLADSILCNDITIHSGTGTGLPKSSTDIIYFKKYVDLHRDSSVLKPSLECAKGVEYNYSRFTVDKYKTIKGIETNGDLTYPIGLLTADELVMSGAYRYKNNFKYYLYNEGIKDEYYWTMTPIVVNTTSAGGFFSSAHSQDGKSLNNTIYHNDDPRGVRPVINLKKEVLVKSGNGTKNNPYTVKLN